MKKDLIQKLNETPYLEMDAYDLGANYLKLKYSDEQPKDTTDKGIQLLLYQYYYGIAAKHELKAKLEEILGREVE
jgi:transposase